MALEVAPSLRGFAERAEQAMHAQWSRMDQGSGLGLGSGLLQARGLPEAEDQQQQPERGVAEWMGAGAAERVECAVGPGPCSMLLGNLAWLNTFAAATSLTGNQSVAAWTTDHKEPNLSLVALFPNPSFL